MRRFALTALALALTVPLGLACGHDRRPPGSAVVPWHIIGGQTCAEAGIGLVEVELVYGQGELYDSRMERCEAGSVRFDTVDPGAYRVQVWGYPPTPSELAPELTRNDSIFEASYPELEVRSEQESTPEGALVLSARPAGVYVRWKFHDGEQCFVKGVSTVEVVLSNGFSVKGGGEFPCELSHYIAGLPEEQQAAAARRGVFFGGLDPQTLTVEAYALDPTEARLYEGRAQVTLDFGEVKELVLTLDACTTGCP